MKKRIDLRTIVPLLVVFMATASFAQDYIIFSIVQDVPMGYKDEVLKKNYYVNIGKNQGLQNGNTLSVFRSLSRVDPYDSNKRHTYKVKIGELEVIHSNENAAIANLKTFRKGEKVPLFENKGFMIGDNVNIKLD